MAAPDPLFAECTHLLLTQTRSVLMTPWMPRRQGHPGVSGTGTSVAASACASRSVVRVRNKAETLEILC
jgi:hypothetical protein